MRSLDDFFVPTSRVVAENLIGMNIESSNGIYVVTATKPYIGETRQTQSRKRVEPGMIIMFNVRGNPHFCISTGKGKQHDYVLINRIKQDTEITSARGVSEALGVDMEFDGRKFSDYFSLHGEKQPSTVELYQGEASTCLGIFELRK